MILQAGRSVMRKLGYDVLRKPAAMMREGAEFMPTLEMLAPHVGRATPAPVFVQIGAYDGEADDPLAQAAISWGWRGVLVEPQPEPFAKLAAFHAGRPEFQVRNAAIAPEEGVKELFTFRSDADLPDFAWRHASFDRSHLLKMLRKIGRAGEADRLIVGARVPCVTFDRLLSEANLDHVDVLQIDTEGYDLRVLELFDVKRRLPTIVNFEHAHLSNADWNTAVELLTSCGYRVGKAGGDTSALRLGGHPGLR